MDGNSQNIERRIALLAGGNSPERAVSLASGEQVALALAAAGYEAVAIDPAETALAEIDWPNFDCCFLALHGGAGEDGRVQRELEVLGVPYTGSRPEASRLAMSKAAAKERFLQQGVPTLPYLILPAGPVASDNWPLLESLGYPLVIKPESQGSSLGVSLATSIHEVAGALTAAGRYDDFFLAEPFVAGREFTVALLGRDPLPLLEIVAPQPLFTYAAKYSTATTEYRCDTGLPPAIEAAIYDAAIRATEALGTAGLVRVDIMLDSRERPWVLEVNTIPGLTARSLVPRAARAAGIELPALVDWMVRDGVHRAVQPRRDKIAAHPSHRLRRPFILAGDDPGPTTFVEYAA